nr:sesquiterpene synthase [Collybia nuda]
MADVIVLPDTLRNWPWPRSINPFYEVCKAESSKWCEGFRAFSPSAQRAFNKCDFNLLASLAYPLLNRDGCRIGCDLMNLFFVIDEHSDVADMKTARSQANIIMDALRNPLKPRPKGEWIGGEVARQFWENAIRSTTPTAQSRFVETFQSYTDAVVEQAKDRHTNHIRDIGSYMDVRRDTIGAKPSLAICQVHMNIPSEILEHPIIAELTRLCIDMLIIGNDLCSYNVEQARGDDGHNLVAIVCHEMKFSLERSFHWISVLHDDLVERFLRVWRDIPTFGGPIDREVRTYVDGLGNWVRANDQWSFESERYFGKMGLEIMQTRRVKLLPKQHCRDVNLPLTERSLEKQLLEKRPKGPIAKVITLFFFILIVFSAGIQCYFVL